METVKRAKAFSDREIKVITDFMKENIHKLRANHGSGGPGERRRMWVPSIQPMTEGNPRTQKKSLVTRRWSSSLVGNLMKRSFSPKIASTTAVITRETVAMSTPKVSPIT
ncbi:hypothetical protein DPMN_096112 [Dreissena polymorpha]|uniref:Uncharacterized protein n=1 Tax=Dreissena polymorpha TaxID=45954 RepID=A0A9D4L835_DREPO|nr:hypothetical protein DPMN_096112 [Dreissena polymorpha]